MANGEFNGRYRALVQQVVMPRLAWQTRAWIDQAHFLTFARYPRLDKARKSRFDEAWWLLVLREVR